MRMVDSGQCLACYLPLEEDEVLYHPGCARKVFGHKKPPELSYGYDELGELAQRVIRSKVTVPGVQKKLSIHLGRGEGGVHRFTLVGLWGNFILKPPTVDYPSMPEIEDLTMHLAEIFQIKTVPHCLIPLQTGELSYLTSRVDRLPNGEKLLMEDMCQLTERLTEYKYHGSMEQIGKVIKTYSSNPGFDSLAFFEMILFTFLTGNADMHLKNFSLLYPVDGMVQLAPAYDMLATRLILPEEVDPEEMALTVNGKKSRLKKRDFDQFAKTMGLTSIQVRNVMQRFGTALPQALSFVEKGLIPYEKQQELIRLMEERFERLSWDK